MYELYLNPTKTIMLYKLYNLQKKNMYKIYKFVKYKT